MTISSGEESLDLNSIKFPTFNPAQLAFFKQMIELHKQDRLNLDPRDTPRPIFNLQWNSLESMQKVYEWLINSNAAVEEAERQERINGTSYEPQQLLASINDDTKGVDLNNLTF